MKRDLSVSRDQLKWNEREFIEHIDAVKSVHFYDDGYGLSAIRVEARMRLRKIKELINGKPNILINLNPSPLFCRWAKQMAEQEENAPVSLFENPRLPETRQIIPPNCQLKCR